MKNMFYIILLTFSIFISCAYAGDENVSEIDAFKGGLNQKAINFCNNDMEAQCKATDGLIKYLECAKQSFSNNSQCKQNLAFLRDERGFFSLIKDYGSVAVVKAKVYAADHSEDFFMVDKKGELIKLTWQADFGKSKEYQELKKQFASIDLWPIATTLPEVTTSEDGTVRIVFPQLLLNGCHACEQVGIAKIAYEFSADGEYLGSQLVEIIPTLAQQGQII